MIKPRLKRSNLPEDCGLVLEMGFRHGSDELQGLELFTYQTVVPWDGKKRLV